MAPAKSRRTGEITLNDALDSIRGGSQKERLDAIGDLIFLFEKRGKTPEFTALVDKHYHRMFEALFHCAIAEKQSFFSGRKTTKTAAASRLSKCAEALRLVSTHGASKLKRKTMLALVAHITETLPGPDDEFVEQLSQDYFRALVALLGHAANVELLSTCGADGWLTCVDFCTLALSNYLEEAANEPASLSRGSPAPGTLPSTGRSASSTQRLSVARFDHKDVLQCLLSLVMAPNAPVSARANDIASVAMKVLHLRTVNLGLPHQLAFGIVNTILSATQADDLAMAGNLSQGIIREISHWWKSPSVAKDKDAQVKLVKDEMTKCIFLIYLHVYKQASRPGASAILDDIQELADTLRNEYARRDPGARLQLDDLVFSSPSLLPHHFQTTTFALSNHNSQGERRWGFLQALSMLEGILWECSKHSPDFRDQQAQPRKRRKVLGSASRIRERLAIPDPDVRMGAIHLTPFLLSSADLSRSEVELILDDISPLISSKEAQTSSWAMVALASCVLFLADGDFQESIWKPVWQVAVRLVSMPRTSRAACLLLNALLQVNALPYTSLSEEVNTIVTTPDTNGPAVLVDSSVALMHRLLHLRNTHLPNASQATSHHIIRWIFSRWHPADLEFATGQARHAPAVDISSLLSNCSGCPIYQPSSAVPGTGGSISQEWKNLTETEPMMRYLLLLGSCPPRHLAWSDTDSDVSGKAVIQVTDVSNFQSAKKLTLELLYPKLEEVLAMAENWTRRDSPTKISVERLHSTLSFCIVCSLLVSHLHDVSSRQSQDLDTVFLKTIDILLQAVLNSGDTQTFFGIVHQCIRPFLPALSSTPLQVLAKDHPLLSKLFVELSGALDQKATQASSSMDPDFMDLDDEFESQASGPSASVQVIDMPRLESAMALSQDAFYINTSIRLRLMGALDRNPDKVGTVPWEFLDYLLCLPDNEFLAGASCLPELLESDIVINPDDGEKLLEKMGGIVSEPGYTCCEVALCACLELMRGLSAAGAEPDHNLHGMIADLYGYFVTKTLPNKSLSPKGQMALANLLFFLLSVDSEYGKKLGLPSCRSSLLSMLEKDGSIYVKYFIGLQLPDLFGLYVLKTHDKIFVDVLEALPADPGFAEGIAFRLFALSELACRWSTLLRRCIYHIFETPGSVPASTDYAEKCLARISRDLKLKTTQELFHLFAPQLLFTWLEDASIDTIPYRIFGFQSLRELFEKTSDEAAALMVMRGQDDGLLRLAEILAIPSNDLIRHSFAKIMAYSIAHSFHGSSQHQNSVESRLKQLLGKETFVDLLYRNYVDILGIFFQSYDAEDDPSKVEKSFKKNGTTAKAFKVLLDIMDMGHSPALSPPSQQPAFKGRYLPSQLHYMSVKTRYELSDMWTAPLVVAISRSLINTVHPALGSLDACVAIRRLRLVMALAGPVAYEPYPLEMLLHSMRPFLVDSECADDALGMSKYLLLRGQDHLSRSPSFLAGYALSVLASLRVFLESSQASTTQESQFKATKSKAQHFHSWFSEYLAQYKFPPFHDTEQRNAFKSITQSAAHIRSSGSADKGTHEGTLLLEILKDGERPNKLLNDSARELAMEMLCGDFRIPSSSRVDVVESDQNALDHGAVVWRSCHSSSLNDNYLSWAGRVVGRSFAASGEIDPQVLRETGLHQYAEQGSRSAMLRLLRDLASSNVSHTAGVAEATLRLIITKAAGDGDDELLAVAQKSLNEPLAVASNWGEFEIPPTDEPRRRFAGVSESQAYAPELIESSTFASTFATNLALSDPDNIILCSIAPVLAEVETFARQAFPFVLHLTLLSQIDKQLAVKRSMSTALKDWLANLSTDSMDNIKLLVDAAMYLRTQPIPGESSIADRLRWLDIDLPLASAAAIRCDMFKTALLLTELASSEPTRSSRRSSAAREVTPPPQLLTEIFQNIDDPDAYYGLPQDSSLAGIMARLEYEKDGSKSLAFRGAQYDSHLRTRDPEAAHDSQFLVKALGNLGLSGLSHSLLQSQQGVASSSAVLEETFTTAQRLEMWNLPAPVTNENHAVSLYTAYQGVHQSQSIGEVRQSIHTGLRRTMKSLTTRGQHVAGLRQKLGTLAVLSELDDILACEEPQDLDHALQVFDSRCEWMRRGRYDDISHILSSRVTTLSMLGRQNKLPNFSKISAADARVAEIRSMMLSSKMYRFHGATQESLNVATSLRDLIRPSEQLGLTIDVAVMVEAANALWDHGENIPSIRLLQGIEKESSFQKQTVPATRSDILSKIAHQVSVARLEKPDRIQKNYLEPALKELKGKDEGREAGQVYHQFAMFCDEQLQSPEGLEDLVRLRNLKRGKSDEVAELKNLIAKTRDSQQRNKYQRHLSHAKQWLELDEQELHRVEQTRSEFVRLSLENYLLSLAASDEYNNDVLRFTALWMEQSGDESANEVVKRRLDKVPTRKFAPLMNQLTSRLLNQGTTFQKCLSTLILGICTDHPFHGMYQIWAATKSKANSKDEIAVSRQKATSKVADSLARTQRVAHTWHAIDRTNSYYFRLANERDAAYTSGKKLPISKSPAAVQLANALIKYQLPPCTMQLDFSANCDYSSVPLVSQLDPAMSIASGISAPKIITALGSDGKRYKQLVKGGNDDLRQDAIMEQVFSAVSSVLKLHRETQQRKLLIRTYKVLPLTSNTGVIEFVSNTIPLHEYLIPAHEKYYPKDLKGSQCRKEIHQVQNKSLGSRLAAYRKVTEKFHPVMHYFFLENFEDPDDWFANRLAYTRSTAAVSIVGHVIGLGDRHGHNILLDKLTGEAVHIDLGVCFEQGRILPVPELVPFRLTRDIVDGMGITGTEGVFRRCCEVTLDALRAEEDAIMMVLDVLRYDPLYSWSISPVRLAKLQAVHGSEEDGGGGAGDGDGGSGGGSDGGGGNTGVGGKNGGGGGKKGGGVNEPSEADRALEVVRKKLSKTLSVNATVNDLINQASDERHLAVLYSGWAAYA